MNKSQLISAVAEKTSVPKGDVKRVFDALFDLAEQKLGEDEKVVISGFGVFSTIHVSERTGRNPATHARASRCAYPHDVWCVSIRIWRLSRESLLKY